MCPLFESRAPISNVIFKLSDMVKTGSIHTGPVRREVVKRAGSPDSHHRMLPERPVLPVKNTRNLTTSVMHHRHTNSV